MPCEKRDRLNREYLDNVGKVLDSGDRVFDLKTNGWKETTMRTRTACEDSLAALNRHRREHGC